MIKNLVSGIISVLFFIFNLWCFAVPVNGESFGFWFLLMLTAVVFAICSGIGDVLACDDISLGTLVGVGAGVLIFFVSLLIGFGGSRMFHASTFQKQMSVTTAEFATDMKEENVSSLSLMDSESAMIYSKRVMGELPEDMVSVYATSEKCSTISYQGKPMKVSPLVYAGWLKAVQNKEVGIPGYVMIDPVNYTAKYVKLESPMLYTPDAVFSHKLSRVIRKEDGSALLGETFFEIDEEGNPFYITQKYTHKVGLFNCNTIVGVFITNPCTGEVNYYDVPDVPEWVDIVFDGDYISGKYDDFGSLKKGWWNSFTTQKGCTVVTKDFGYKIIGEDVYIYTGVTSKASDESNVGFILVNSRTMETKYYSVVGAEEYSAMNSAEGEVQQYGYHGSFPSLINVEGTPTYVLVLKDDNGLVKKIAMVNVEHYDIVAVEDNLNKARSTYLKLLSKRGVTDKKVSDDSLKKVQATITSIEFISMDGSTTVYVKTTNGVFKADFDETYLLLNEGDEVSISYYETDETIEYIDSITH